MAYHVELRPLKKSIILTNNGTRIVIDPYRKEERMWLAITAPKAVKIEHLSKGEST